MRPFPLLKAVAGAYREPWYGAGEFVRLAGLWVLAPILLAGVVPRLLRPLAGDGPALSVAISLGLAGWAVCLVGLSAVTVAWLRHLLLGEETRGPMAPLGRRVLTYLAASLAVWLAIAVLTGLVLFVLATLLAGPGGEAAPLLSLPAMHVLAGTIGATVMARTHLIFPAIAVDDRAMPVWRSWQLTADHTVPLFVGLIVAAVPMMLLGSLAQAGLAGLGSGGGVLGLLAITLAYFVQGVIVATFLGRSYRFFVTEVAVAPPAPPPLS